MSANGVLGTEQLNTRQITNKMVKSLFKLDLFIPGTSYSDVFDLINNGDIDYDLILKAFSKD